MQSWGKGVKLSIMTPAIKVILFSPMCIGNAGPFSDQLWFVQMPDYWIISLAMPSDLDWGRLLRHEIVWTILVWQIVSSEFTLFTLTTRIWHLPLFWLGPSEWRCSLPICLSFIIMFGIKMFGRRHMPSFSSWLTNCESCEYII